MARILTIRAIRAILVARFFNYASLEATMPKKLHDTLNARISAEIARHRDGIGIEGLHVALASARQSPRPPTPSA